MSLQRKTIESRFDLSPSEFLRPSEVTKVLIPYDGSERSLMAFNELHRVGLPPYLDTLVAVTHVWLPMSPYEITRAVSARRLKTLTAGVSSFVPALRDVEEQRVLSLDAERRIRSIFPSATVRTESIRDVALVTNEILRRAEKWEANLIIVGANSSPSPDITDYAGPAIKVAQDAHCSVRIARASNRSVDSPVRIVIGVDGSKHSGQVVRTVANRSWLPESHVRLIAGRKSGPRQFSKDSETTSRLTQFADELKAAGLEVSVAVRDGSPQDVVLHEARQFSADCILVHTRGLGNRFDNASNEHSLDDVAQALLLGAHCSVEVVRKNFSELDVKPAA